MFNNPLLARCRIPPECTALLASPDGQYISNLVKEHNIVADWPTKVKMMKAQNGTYF